jgi:predicted O-methyltransferase YrrM
MRLDGGNRDSMTRKSNIVIKALEILRREGIAQFSRNALTYIRRECLILPYAFLAIRRINLNSLDDLVDFCFNGVGGVIEPLQIRDEIMGLLRIFSKTRPKVVIEIGTAAGGTLFLFCRMAAKDATLISIDLPGGIFGGGYSWWRIPLYKKFGLQKQKLHLIRGDSHSQETLDRVKNILGNREVDFVFIDGDHAYEGVKKDFEMFTPLVKKGGIIAFHDIVVHPAEIGCDVNRLWDEIKESKKYDYTEIVSDWNQGQSGIGILRWRT